LIIAVVAAVAAGCSFSIGAVLQQSAARRAPDDVALSWRLLATLAHRKMWLAGIASDAVSFGLQALALAFGPLALVQPLLVCGLLFALPVAVRRRHRRLGVREWAGTVAVAGGLAAFLAAASPSQGTSQPTPVRWIALIAVLGAVMLAAALVGRSAHGTLRPSLYALAAGTGFGLLAALTKTSTALLGEGAVAFFTAWQPYGMAVVAAVSAIVQQSAFQAGPLPVSLPVMDATEPAVATLLGVVAFGERVSLGPGSVTVEVLGVLLLLAGIVTLDRSPVIHALQRRQPRKPDPAEGAGEIVASEA
jgi:drug/metabolite transporter (DMT)-like permease